MQKSFAFLFLTSFDQLGVSAPITLPIAILGWTSKWLVRDGWVLVRGGYREGVVWLWVVDE